MAPRASRPALSRLFRERIVVIDGAVGTMIQSLGLGEADFRGDRFASHPRELAGDNDLLSLTRPEAVAKIHDAYLAAGADLILTNTFSATRVAQRDYGMQHVVSEMNRAAAQIAVRAAAEWSERTPDKPRYVAGAVGPTNKTLSISPDVEDAAKRDVDFDALRDHPRYQSLLARLSE